MLFLWIFLKIFPVSSRNLISFEGTQLEISCFSPLLNCGVPLGALLISFAYALFILGARVKLMSTLRGDKPLSDCWQSSTCLFPVGQGFSKWQAVSLLVNTRRKLLCSLISLVAMVPSLGVKEEPSPPVWYLPTTGKSAGSPKTTHRGCHPLSSLDSVDFFSPSSQGTWGPDLVPDLLTSGLHDSLDLRGKTSCTWAILWGPIRTPGLNPLSMITLRVSWFVFFSEEIDNGWVVVGKEEWLILTHFETGTELLLNLNFNL